MELVSLLVEQVLPSELDLMVLNVSNLCLQKYLAVHPIQIQVVALPEEVFLGIPTTSTAISRNREANS